jgi:hypothetical protein
VDAVEQVDLFFYAMPLRGYAMQDLAGFLNRSEDEVRQQAGSRCHDSISSSMTRSSKLFAAQRRTNPLSPPIASSRAADYSAACLRHRTYPEIFLHARLPSTASNGPTSRRFRILPRLQAKLI